MTAIEHDDNLITIERQLVDVVVRHELGDIDLAGDTFTDWACRRYWNAITALWNADQPPSITNVVAELERRHLETSDCTAADLMFLPLGYRLHLDDYIAVLTNATRRRRLSVLLADAAESIAAGADPDSVLARITQLAS